MIKTLNNLLDKEFVYGKQDWKFLYLFRLLDKLIKLYPDNEEIKQKFDDFVIYCDKLCEKTVGENIPEPIVITIKDALVKVFIDNEPQFINPDLYIQSDDVGFSYDSYAITNVQGCQTEDQSNFKYILSDTFDPPLYWFGLNQNTDPCTANILGVQNFDPSLVEEYQTKKYEAPSMIFFKRTEKQGYPDDAVFYINFSEVNSFSAPEIATLKSQVLAWYALHQTDSTNLVSNFIRNDEIPGEAPVAGREDVGAVSVLVPDELDYTRDSWINGIIHANLRLAYKIGLGDFANEADFLAYVAGRKIVVINFEHEINGFYQDAEAPYNNVKIAAYKSDYNNFTTTLVEKLAYFKGVTSHIGKLSDGYINFYPLLSFLMTAFENTQLTLSECEALAGSLKYNYLQSIAPAGTVFDFLFEKLTYQNPLNFQNNLRNLGWSVDYQQSYVASLTEINFLTYLNQIAGNNTFVEEETLTFPTLGLGTTVPCTFDVQVESQGYFSNVAEVTIEYQGVCEPLPICDEYDEIIFSQNVPTIITPSAMGIDDSVALFIRIKTLSSDNCGVFLYKGNPLLVDDVIPYQDLVDGDLVYHPNNVSLVQNCEISFTYEISLTGFVYCEEISSFTVINEFDPNQFVVTVDFDFPSFKKCAADLADVSTDTGNLNIGYNGDPANLSYFWYQLGNPVPLNTDHSTPDFIFEGLDNNSFIFSLYVVDIYGNNATHIDTFTITDYVEATTNIPANVVLPDDVTTYNLTTMVLNDPDGISQGNLWAQTGGPMTATITEPTDLNPTFSDMDLEGIYSFKFILFSLCERFEFDFTITTSKSPAPNLPPTVNAGPDDIINFPASTYNLFATANDPEGQPMTFLWTVISSPIAVTFDDDTILNPVVSGMSVEGDYTLEIEATDDVLQTATDTIMITVRRKVNRLRMSNRNDIIICSEEYTDQNDTRVVSVYNPVDDTIAVGDEVLESDQITPVPDGDYSFLVNGKFKNHRIIGGFVTLVVCP